MVKALLDPYGDPIPREQIDRALAGPDLGKMRQVWTGMYQSAGLTPQRVAQAMRQADAGYEAAWLHLCEEMEEKDAHYAAVLGVRKRSVQQLPTAIEAASEDAKHQEHAEFLRKWLATGALDLAIFDMLDAVSKGFSVHEIEWETNPKRIWPKRLVYRYAHWFGVDKDDGETVKLRENASLVELPHYKFVIHKSTFKSGALIRGGLARVAVWSWMFKSFTMKDWSTFVQNYGQPIRLGKYGAGATERDKQALWEAIANIAGDMAAMVPESMKLEFIGMKEAAKTSEIYIERCKYLDQQISKIVLGQTSTVDAISGGHAVSQEHEKVRQDIERADAASLSATLTHQLVPLIVSLNFGPQEDYPRLRIGRPDELPLKDLVDAADKLGKLGLVIPAAPIRQRIGMPDPQPGEEVIGGHAPAMPKKDGATDRAEDLAEDEDEPKQQQTELQATKTIEPFDLVERMVTTLAAEAGASVEAMLKEIRKELNAASSLEEARARLEEIELQTHQFDEKLARAMALAHLAGQATIIDQTEL